MTSPRLSEEQLVALEHRIEVVAGDVDSGWRRDAPEFYPVVADILADLRAARAERDALLARLERASDALRRWDALPPEHGEAARGLSLAVRLDAGRLAGSPPWTVAIQGVDRGDAHNPHDAAARLRERLLDLVRDAEEGRLARARLEKAREALAQFRGEVLDREDYGGHSVECAHSEGDCRCGLDDLRAALEGETT